MYTSLFVFVNSGVKDVSENFREAIKNDNTNRTIIVLCYT